MSLKAKTPEISGAVHRATHQQSVTAILGTKTVAITSAGNQFFNMDNWTLRLLTGEMSKDFGQPLSRALIQKWVTAANKTVICKPEIRIADTPDHMSMQTLNALVGGAYHEAWHTKYSCKRPLTVSEVYTLLENRWEKIRKIPRAEQILLDLSNIVEDIRIERLGTKEYPGTPEKMVELQTFILDMEEKSWVNAGKPKRDALSLVSMVFRDFGLGYESFAQKIAIDSYRQESPDVVNLIENGALKTLLNETIALKATQDTECLRIAMDILIVLASLSNGQGQQGQGQSGQGQQGQGQSGQGQSGQGQSGQGQQGQGQSGQGQSGQGQSGQGQSGQGQSGQGQQGQQGQGQSGQGQSGQGQQGQQGQGQQGQGQQGQGQQGQGQSGQGQSGQGQQGQGQQGQGQQGQGQSGQGQQGQGQSGQGQQGQGQQNQNGQPGQGQSGNTQSGQQGKGLGNPQDNGAQGGRNGGDTDNSKTLQDMLKGALNSKNPKGPGMLDNNAALEQAFENIVKEQIHREGGIKKGEARYKPYSKELDTVNVINQGKPIGMDAMNSATVLLNQVKAQTSFLRARMRNIFRAMEMTNTVHGIRKGSALSERMLVDSRVALMGGCTPDRAYQQTDEHMDVSIAAAIVLDESGSMCDKLDVATKVMIALTEPLDGIGAKVQVSGFRDNRNNNSNYDYNSARDCHQWSGVTNDVFKLFDERFAAVKGRFVKTRADGGTPMANGMQFALDSLSARKEGHRFLFVITDGAPDGNHTPVINRQIRLAKQSGIHVVGVGLGYGSQYVKNLFPDHVYSDDFAKMPKLLVDKLNELIDTTASKRGVKYKED